MGFGKGKDGQAALGLLGKGKGTTKDNLIATPQTL